MIQYTMSEISVKKLPESNVIIWLCRSFVDEPMKYFHATAVFLLNSVLLCIAHSQY